MKKLFKELDHKFLISLLIILALLSTVVAYAIVTTEMDSRGSEADKVPEDGRYLTGADLKNMYDILCCYHGGKDSLLPSQNQTVLTAGGMSTETTESGKEIARLVGTDEGNQTALRVKKSYPDLSSPFNESSYSAKTYGYYNVKETKIPSPDNAYILAEMIAETDGSTVFYDDGYSAIQYAWWVTDDNHGTNHSTVNSLSEEATAFNNYISKIGNTDPKTYVEQHYKFTLDNGTVKEGDVPAPVLTYNPTNNEDANQDGEIKPDDPTNDKVTTSWDSNKQTWTVGPFSIDYVEESFDAGDRNPVMFAGITNADIYTNLGEVPDDKWRFNFIKDERDTADDYQYPHANEVFYVEIDFIDGATKLTNIHFDFKYMNAGGKFDSLNGTYYIQKWSSKGNEKVTRTCSGSCGHSSHDQNSTCERTCEHRFSSRHVVEKEYWLTLVGMNETPSQLLAYGIIGARWYEYASLDIGVKADDEHSGKFKITKKIVDDEGNEVQVNDDEKFEFKIYLNDDLYNTVELKANSTYTSEEFKWKDGESAPIIKVEEVGADNGYELVSLEPSGNTTLKDRETVEFVAKNKETEHHGNVSIKKEQIGKGLEDLEFSFKLYIDNKVYVDKDLTEEDGTIHVKVDETWTSGDIVWKGNTPPKYKVSEVNLPEEAKLVNLENDTGVLSDNATAKVVAINTKDTKYENATITLKKVLTGGATSSESFSFKVKVGDKVFDKTLKAGQSWSETFTWEKGTQAPEYEVSELDIPKGWKLVEIKNPSGILKNGENVEVICENAAEEEKSTKLSITKHAYSDDKEGVDGLQNLEFSFTARISGTFEYGNESIVNGTRTITTTLRNGETWNSETIKWTGDAPTYEVTETAIPEGWKLESITNAKGTLKDKQEAAVVCTNVYKITVEYELTMEMAGMVWEDKPVNPEDKNTENSVANGKYDNGIEEGIEKVEVTIYKKVYDSNGNEIVGLRSLAKGFEDHTETEITYPLYTSLEGVWKAPRMQVPGLTDAEKEAGAVKADYDVEFTYDGQTYRPTDFLVSGNVGHFRKASNSQKTKYLNDSMAYEVKEEREAFDEKFETITGNSPIDADGVTQGYSVSPDGKSTDLTYYSMDSMESLDGNTRKVSELQTTEDGYIYNDFKMSSRTSTGGLTYPFNDKVHLENIRKNINKIEGGLVITYEYSATYPYLLNINLGLVRRDEAELSTTKDVYSAAVVVNQKLLNYKFNEYVDFESEKYQDYLDLQLKVADANISYKLDLYESDYYYRAKVYEGTEVNGALEEFYKTLGKTNLSDELDLDVFLTYKVSLYNNSDSYYAQIKDLADYFDEDLEVVETEVSRYIQQADGTSVDSETVVAKPAYVIKKGKTEDSAWGEQVNKSLAGKVKADYGKKYNSSIQIDALTSNNPEMGTTENVVNEGTKAYYKANVDLNDSDLKLAAGEKLEVYLTFKVRTDDVATKLGDSNTVADAAKSYVRLGTKANIAEISSYSTYYIEGGVAGKVDKDSAPNNIDIENKNDKSWYEDDADSAPIITLDLYNETRDVNGMAWEDKETETIDYNQKVGNGIYDEGERLIGNLTTQMVEKVRVKQSDGTYKEYDFVWPTGTAYDFLNGKTLEEITGFDSITLTSNSPENTGAYSFKNIPAGNYVVRFTYGNFAADKLDENGNLIKLDGVAEPQTSDDNTRKPAVYNGQDFKTTAYQADSKGQDGKTSNVSNDAGYIDNEWYDFSTCKYDDEGNVINHNSDAMDSEARRLEVIAYSRVLDNENTTVLATANNYTADHTTLYEKTSMFADTAKINLNIENMNKIAGQKIVVTNELTGATETVVAGGEETRNNLMSNFVHGKSDLNGNKGTVSLINYNYVIDAIDIGLEERSNTELVLDKEIESITLTTNTGDTILKAVYDISYDYDLNRDTGKASYKANVKLNEEQSYGTTNLMAQNKDEEAGLQNFRYIYYDDTISQALNLKVVYKFTALNVGEVDRATAFVEGSSPEQLIEKANEIKEQVYRKEGKNFVNINHKNVGEYLGSIYYIGKNEAYNQSDIVATTTVRQLIDYIDNDAVFKASDNTELNSSWKTVTPDELLESKAINSSIIGEYDGVKNIVDDKGVVYTSNERNNLVLSVDTVLGEKLANPGFITKLVPFSASKENGATEQSCMASMNMIMTRSIDSQIDDDDLSYDNIAEIVKFENTVGKRDIETIAGNQDPKEGEFKVSLDERDASATELITFTPPTGLGVQKSLTTEMLIVIAAALVILVIGIIIIKKTILKK